MILGIECHIEIVTGEMRWGIGCNELRAEDAAENGDAKSNSLPHIVRDSKAPLGLLVGVAFESCGGLFGAESAGEAGCGWAILGQFRFCRQQDRDAVADGERAMAGACVSGVCSCEERSASGIDWASQE